MNIALFCFNSPTVKEITYSEQALVLNKGELHFTQMDRV